MNSQHEYLAKQLDSLKAAAEPSKAELKRLEELTKSISEEEKEINRLTEGSKQLKEKVRCHIIYYFIIMPNLWLNICITKSSNVV